MARTERYQRALEIKGPTAECGNCGFLNSLEGRWFIKGGQLVWKGDTDDLLPYRGPSIDHCGECGQEFEFITLDGDEIAADQAEALRTGGSMSTNGEGTNDGR